MSDFSGNSSLSDTTMTPVSSSSEDDLGPGLGPDGLC